ncbi:MAG: response regulator transcription factor [Gammaproteobacteria bacterium]|nr:response regulator transcription factor [Gammaproteobacteria bacterium]
MVNILIVEDDIDIAQGLAEFLEPKGYLLDFAYHGKQAINYLNKHHYDLVLLDVNLPFINGFDVCRSLLQDKLARLPVIIMSARGTTEDILKGFDSGAWDYLVKPFSFAELSARISANLAKAISVPKKVLYFNGVELDESTMTFHFENKVMQLHQVGFDIVKTLLNVAPNVVKTKVLHHALWGDDTPDSDPLRAHIYKLRKKFSQDFGQSFITTIKGVGYRFDFL